MGQMLLDWPFGQVRFFLFGAIFRLSGILAPLKQQVDIVRSAGDTKVHDVVDGTRKAGNPPQY